MAMTAGVINGTDILVYVGGVAISYSTSCTLTITGAGAIPVSSKDSGVYLDKLIAKGHSWSVSVSGMGGMDGGDLDLREIYDLFRANASVSIRFSTEVAGNFVWSGDAVATGFSMDAPDNEGSTFSCDFEGLGRLNIFIT